MPFFFLPLTVLFSASGAATIIFTFGKRLTAMSAFVFTLQSPVSGVVPIPVSILVLRAFTILLEFFVARCA